jgi:DNA polymerase III alpha subunit
MNKKLLQTLNRSLESVKTTHYALVTIEALQARLTEELDWMDADPGRECLIILLHELTAKMRSASIVVSPGYSFLPDSYLLFLTGVTRVNPVEWNLPFSHFTKSVHDGAEIPFEAGTGCLEVARKVLSGRENEMIIETELGLFEITFLDGIELTNVKLRIITSAELDRFSLTIKEGWHPLDEATLRLFSRGATDGTIFFESDKMREWLFDFDPESMSDLVLLNAIYWPGRIQLFEELLRRKQTGDFEKQFKDTYGIPVYQEQTGEPTLAPKGHFIGSTMMAVEALWPYKNKTKLR